MTIPLAWARITALALFILGLSAAPGVSQMCRGVPAQYVHLMVERQETAAGTSIYTGELGLSAPTGETDSALGITGGRRGLVVDYARGGGNGGEGSKTISYAARIYQQVDGNIFALCAFVGYSGGKAYIVNVEGSNQNMRIWSRALLFAAALGVGGDLGPARAVLFVIPGMSLDSREYELYDRVERLEADDGSVPFTWTLGASLGMGPAFGRVTLFKHPDRDAVFSLGVGLSW
jgi:hypothetical protein